MSQITPDVVQHVALLGRLELTDDEVEHFSKDLNNILEYANTLNELDTSDVPPTSHSFHLENVFREDVVRPSLTIDEALANAPSAEDGCFKVPAILQDSGGA